MLYDVFHHGGDKSVANRGERVSTGVSLEGLDLKKALQREAGDYAA